MSRRSEAVKRWRRNTKERMVESMGGKCVCCGYNKCSDALVFHHVDPKEKDFAFGGMRSCPKKWDVIVDELRKCVLVCSRCHQEIHAGVTDLPEEYEIFNEKFVKYKEKNSDLDLEPCPVCGGKKSFKSITCSKSCAAKRAGKVDWESIDLEFLMKRYSYVEIGDMLGISDVAVRKRAKKLNLI